MKTDNLETAGKLLKGAIFWRNNPGYLTPSQSKRNDRIAFYCAQWIIQGYIS